MAERSYCREEGQAQEQSGVPPAEDGGGRWPPAVFQPQSSSEAPRGEGPRFRGQVQTLTHTRRRLAHLSALSGLLCRGGQREHPPPGAAMERKGLRLRKEPRPAPGHVGASHHCHCHSPASSANSGQEVEVAPSPKGRQGPCPGPRWQVSSRRPGRDAVRETAPLLREPRSEPSPVPTAHRRLHVWLPPILPQPWASSPAA